MDRRNIQQIAVFVAIGLFIAGWTILLHYYTPAEVIDWLGVTNSYFVIFTISVLGAIASITPFSAYPAIYTMAAGGVSPIAVVVLAGIGLTIGDMIFIYFGITARQVFPDKFEESVARVLRWLTNKSTLFVQIFVFFWIGFLPLANNLITAPLAITGFSVKKLVTPVLLGNLMFPIFAASLGYFGVELFWADE